jgi:hypothetical protein
MMRSRSGGKNLRPEKSISGISVCSDANVQEIGKSVLKIRSYFSNYATPRQQRDLLQDSGVQKVPNPVLI